MRYLFLLSILAFCLVLAVRTSAGPAPQQEVIRLESRLSQLEQRFYSVETSVRTLEQQSRMGMNRAGSVTPDDITLLRTEIQRLQARIMEDECALAKLDERTLSPTAREARQRAAGNDPCRANFELPLRPPSR